MRTHWVDRVTSPVAPRWTLKRQRARIASELLQRHYDAASTGRRTQGWRKSGGDANAIVGPALSRLRDSARDLVRNNPYAESALGTLADHAVGTGIVAKPKPASQRTSDLWRRWAETTACDADGRHDFYGLQKLVTRTTVESGEVMVRWRLRQISDDLVLPLQMQILDPDFLDTSKDAIQLPNGGRIINGVEFDGIGRRVAYWLFKEHPGSGFIGSLTSVRVPADRIRHVFKSSRPGQVRGPSWFANTLLRFRDFDEFEDATLMKQKIAACLAVITSDPDGQSSGLGTVDTPATGPQIDQLEPGAILNVAQGRSVDVVSPPSVGEYEAYTKTVLRAIATGLGVTYEDLCGDYTGMPFSAARMSRLRHWAKIDDLRWRILVPQFCDPTWQQFMEIGTLFGLVDAGAAVQWTAPPPPMIDPAAEGLAYMRNIRTGIQSLSDAIRERGYDPETLLQEIADDNTTLDRLGLIVDSDPRKMTQSGQLQGTARPDTAATDAAATSKNDETRVRELFEEFGQDRVLELLRSIVGATR